MAFVACRSLGARLWPLVGVASSSCVEVLQQEEVERRSKEDVAGEVVERIVQGTDLAPELGTTAAESGS